MEIFLATSNTALSNIANYLKPLPDPTSLIKAAFYSVTPQEVGLLIVVIKKLTPYTAK